MPGPTLGRQVVPATDKQTERQTPCSASTFALTRPEMRRDTLAGPLTGHWPMICSESTSGVAGSPSAPFVNRLILKLITCGSSSLLNQLCINENAPGSQGAFVFFYVVVCGWQVDRTKCNQRELVAWAPSYRSLREFFSLFGFR